MHCDPTASHYLKIVLDSIFGIQNFKNEIIWRRSHPKGQAFTRFATNHDIIFFYAKSIGNINWTPVYREYDKDDILKQYRLLDENGRRYQLTSLLNPNKDRPNLTYEFKGVTKVWRWTKERMVQADKDGLIIVPKGGLGIPRFKRYLDEQEGIPVDDLWTDIGLLQGSDSEKLGYPTQKPKALLDRIIQASSNPGDVVMDPFCGCGTAIASAQSLGRQWIGIDITHLAIALIKYRLEDSFPNIQFEIQGEPESVNSARYLAESDRHQFEWWALSLIRARPGQPDGDHGKKGADRGIDGIINFIDDSSGKPQKAIVQVKSGHVSSAQIRDLVGTMNRTQAPIGIFISLEEPTKPMLKEAAEVGFYHSKLWNKDYPKLQILTIEELLKGKELQLPPSNVTFQRAQKQKGKSNNNQLSLLGGKPAQEEE